MEKFNYVLLLIALILVSHGLYAQSVGINADGTAPDGTAMLDVKSTDKGFLPPRMTEDERDAIENPAEGLIVYNTETHRPNYYDGTRWMHFDGSSAGPLAIGDNHQGGIVAYILQAGDPGYDADVQHGIIAATSDQSIGYGTYGLPWYGGTYAATGATGTALGTGQANTNAIVNTFGSGTYAASICTDLVSGGYNDWYLPSKDELNKLYINRASVGGFDEEVYWSSSDVSGPGAWAQSFVNGGQFMEDRTYEKGVRAIRAF